MKKKSRVWIKVCSFVLAVCMIVQFSIFTVFADENISENENAAEEIINEDEKAFEEDTSGKSESIESKENEFESNDNTDIIENVSDDFVQESILEDTKEISEISEKPEDFEETGIFGCNVIDKNGSIVNGWYDSTNNYYYLFLTNAINISEAEINVTGVVVEKTSKGVVDNKKNSVKEAVVNSGDSFTVTDNNGVKYNIAVRQSGLPSVSITLNGTDLDTIKAGSKDTKYAGNTVIITDENGNINVSQSDNVELKGRGNTTWLWFDKRPYQIKFDKKQSVLGMEKAKKWILLANAVDDSLLRNDAAFYLAENLQMPYTTQYKYCELWVDGLYEGNYLIGEKVEIGSGRVELDDTYGVVMEADFAFYQEEDFWCYAEDMGVYFALKESVGEDTLGVPEEAMESFKNKVNALARYVKNTSENDITISELSKYIDVESMAKWYLVNEYLVNGESFGTSQYWYIDGKNDSLHMGPIWDFDTTSGILKGLEGTDVMYGRKNHWMFNKLMSSPEIFSYVRSVYEKYKSIFSSLSSYVSSQENTIYNSAEENYIRWKVLGTSNPKWGPMANSFSQAVSYFKNWLDNRYKFFSAEINTSPLPILKPSADISVSWSQSGKSVKVSAVNIKNTSNIRAAVWSEKNGQDDLRWYDLENNPDGSMSLNIDLTAHGGNDTYNVHVYSGNIPLAGYSKAVTMQQVNSELTADFSEDEGIITVNLTNADDFSKLEIGVWSEENGQDDLKWYSPEIDDNGTATVKVNTSIHGSLGKYFIHVYDKVNKKIIFVNATETLINSIKTPICNADISNNKIVVNLEDAYNYIDLRAAVWGSQNGQNDLKWYSLSETEDGKYSAEINIAEHGEIGNYNIHIYGKNNKKDRFIAGTSIAVSDMADPIIHIEKSDDINTYIIKLENASLYEDISFGVWGDINGQNDLKWYKATLDSDNNWIAELNTSLHDEIGNYNIHAYGNKKSNNMFIAAEVLKVEKIDKAEIETSLSTSSRTARISLDKVIKDCSEVSFGVWSERNGLDDLKWYKANKNADGTWDGLANLYEHKDIGKYFIHAYATISGKKVFLTGTEILIEKYLESELDVSNGMKTINLNLRNADEYDKIRIAVWNNKDGQDDLRWYLPYKRADGSWRYVVNTKLHDGNGKYTIHAYGEINGHLTFVTGTEIEEKAYQESVASVSREENSNMLKIVFEDNFGYTDVKAGVWGTKNGQNDFKWYTLKKDEQGVFSVDVDISKHKEVGNYNIHIYGNYAERQTFGAATNYMVEEIVA